MSVNAAARPRYGGTLRAEMRARVASLDPREWPADSIAAAATEKLAGLVFERLVRLDESGRPQPALAASWQHDADSTRWQFRLRPGVTFHDGAPLTPAVAAAALQHLAGSHRSVSVSGEWLWIQSEQSMPALLEELSCGRHFIFHAGEDGKLSGTGPFRVSEWQAGRRLVLAANEGSWSGRPFLDSIEVEMGIPSARQRMDLDLGKTDAVELAPDQVRRAARPGTRTWSSAPVELLAVVFDHTRPAVQDLRIRQALALSLDRAAVVNVLLQRQGEIAGGLLPHWLSGYAFLFSTAPNLERARQLRSEVGGVSTLSVVYDAADPQARLVAERIAVNAREAGLLMQLIPWHEGSPPPPGDARLARVRLSSPTPRLALDTCAAALDERDALRLPVAAAPEHLFAAERAVVEAFRVIPLAHLPESYGLSARVKNWMPPRWGGWRLEDVWLDTLPEAAKGGGKP